MNSIYFIGGSPCSGKSTIAELIAKKYNLHYFKVDDFLDDYTKRGTKNGLEVCRKISAMSAEETWMREPQMQCEEEFAYYREIILYIMEDLSKTGRNRVITEGAAYLPELMKKAEMPPNRYISITPTEEFQVFHYKQREWIRYVLEGCSDKEKAFSNWMKRDALFAQQIQQQCQEFGYTSIINDGAESIENILDKVTKHFGLEG